MNTKAKSAPETPTEKPADAPTAQPQVDLDTGEVSGIQVGEVKMLKKLVAKDIVGRAKLIYRKTFAPEDKDQKNPLPMEPRQLYVVFGQARDTKTGESDFGPFVAFLGAFEAIDLATGERYVSDKLFLQNPAEGLLAEQLARRDDKTSAVQFSFEIGVKPSQKWIDTDAGNSYEFTVKAHFKLDKADPLAEMRRMVHQHVVSKALPAPTK